MVLLSSRNDVLKAHGVMVSPIWIFSSAETWLILQASGVLAHRAEKYVENEDCMVACGMEETQYMTINSLFFSTE